MKLFFAGIILGIIIALCPFAAHRGGFILTAEWYGSVDSPESIQTSPSIELSAEKIPPVKSNSAVHLLDASGKLVASFPSGGRIISASGNGEYLALYEQAGKFIEFFNIKGDRFWKIKSLEYPFLSAASRIILLLNGDHSAIRLVDFNGNPAGAGNISGRFCTSIAFSKKSDFSAAGFLDGNYYLFNEKGNIVHSGTADGAMIKSMAISSNGKFLALHCGWGNADRLRLVDIERGTYREKPLHSLHRSRMPLFIRDDGCCAFLDGGKFITINRSLSKQFEVPIPASREGHAAIDFNNGIFSATYPLEKGGTHWLLINNSGEILFSKTFENEGFLDCTIGNAFILVRGMKNLYCYGYGNPARQ
jgi:WD40 repeat protein